MKKAILFLSLGSLAVLAFAATQTATASHPHPANTGAKTLTFPVVPAFKGRPPTAPCPAGQAASTHGAPLGAPSCTPPIQTSRNVTTGAIGAEAAPAFEGTSTFKINVVCDTTAAAVPPYSTTPPPCAGAVIQDVALESHATDVRCKAGVAAAACGNENGTPVGPTDDDYIGELQADAQIRITDAYNGAPGFTAHGTVVDLPFPVPAHGSGPNTMCKNTTSATIGGKCDVVTSANAQVPSVVKESKQAVVEIGQIQVRDGGSDGDIDTPGPTARPNELFAVQGIYIP